MSRIILISISLFIGFTMNSMAKKVGRIKMLRGKGEIFRSAKAIPAKANMWIEEGDKITTKAKSFIRIVYTDKSVMNLGPKTEMEIKQFSKTKPGLVNLIKGQLRSKVTRDALSKGKKSKLYIKTKTAAMGIRGTDFHITEIPGERTSLVTYEGEVAMVQVNEGETISYNNMENNLNSEKAVSVKQGQFAGTSKEKEQVSLPVKISPAQLNTLKKNETFESGTKSGAETKSYKPVTPPGVSAKAVTVSANLEKSVAKVGGSATIAAAERIQKQEEAKTEQTAPPENVPPPEGIENKETGEFAPPAGGPIDLKTGIYISPPPGSTFDENTGTYQLPPNFGKIDPETGGYLPPKGLVLTETGDFITEKDAEKLEKIEEQKEAQDKKKVETKTADNKAAPKDGPKEAAKDGPGAGDKKPAAGAGPGGSTPKGQIAQGPGGPNAPGAPVGAPGEGPTPAGAPVPGEGPVGPGDGPEGPSPAGEEAPQVVFTLPPPEIIPEEATSFEVPEFEAPPPVDDSGNILPPPGQQQGPGGPGAIAQGPGGPNGPGGPGGPAGPGGPEGDGPPPEDDGYVTDEDFFDDTELGDVDVCAADPCACGDSSCTELFDEPDVIENTGPTNVTFSINVN